MGQLVSLLSGKDGGADVFIDFENAKPTGAEEAIHSEVGSFLQRGQGILAVLEGYQGCGELIRQALSNPNPETERAAWEGVVERVRELVDVYNFSTEIGKVLPKLLNAISSNDPKQSLVDQQALAKQLADLFDFILRGDELKMSLPQLQNDFAYYRRSFSRMHKASEEPVVKPETANQMSLFFAGPTPMMQSCVDELDKARTPALLNTLATMATVCYGLVHSKRFANPSTNSFLLRAAVGAIVCFDHVDTSGAFVKSSPFKMTKVIKLLKAQDPVPEGLLNALRYSTKHANDDDTPSSVKEALA